jgi:hypothetical protein
MLTVILYWGVLGVASRYLYVVRTRVLEPVTITKFIKAKKTSKNKRTHEIRTQQAMFFFVHNVQALEVQII